MKRTPLVRRSALVRTGRLVRKAMSRKPSKPQQQQQKMRKSAYVLVDERSGGQCEWAVDPELTRCPNAATDHHHRRARAMGGSTTEATEQASNVLHGCRLHHEATHAHPTVSRVLGLIVHQGHSPAAIPVTLWAGSVFLTPEGTYRKASR